MDTKTKAPKEKRRNNEKRKEKSRDAARSRRSRETEIFTDLGNELPLSHEQISQLDKASVMRLAISYLRVRDMIKLVPETKKPERDKEDICNESVFLKSLDGFVLVLSSDGDFVYLSENISEYLGVTQIDLMGQNVFDYSHPCDHDEIRDILSAKNEEDFETPKSVFIRLKCTLTSKGRSVNLKSATYKVIHFTGHIVKDDTTNPEDKNEKRCLMGCLIAIGQPIPHPSNIDTPLPRQTFLTKHSLDMKFTHADDEFMMDVLGYTPEDLLGKSAYEYHHAMDSDSIGIAYKCLFSKGQCETNRYRFLAKTGGYVWVVTQATLIYDKMQKRQSVVCVNYVISGVERKDEVCSTHQYASVKPETRFEEKFAVVRKDKPVAVTAKLLASASSEKDNVRPHTATTKIFAPRTKEMSKGFLTFSEEEPGLTMLKDEPDDLTHLAPVAGDVCIPLDDHPFLTDMLDDFLLKDNFGPLLTEEPSDPFISYRDFHDPSPQLLSPNLSKNSDCSLPSLNSPGESQIDEDQMSTFMNLQMDDDTDILTRAPYIPMNINDDLLISSDLMWSTGDRGKFPSPEPNSSLAQLLTTSVNQKHTLKSSEHGGGGTGNNLKQENRLFKPEDDDGRPPAVKRSRTSYETQSKRIRQEPKEKMSSELLQQLMSNNHNRGRPKGKSNWLLDASGQKAACVSQPSDSVLMNLLNVGTPAPPPLPQFDPKLDLNLYTQKRLKEHRDRVREAAERKKTIRKNSLSLLDPDANGIPSLMDLTEQDYEVNAPVNSFLLQGEELLTALEVNAGI